MSNCATPTPSPSTRSPKGAPSGLYGHLRESMLTRSGAGVGQIKLDLLVLYFHNELELGSVVFRVQPCRSFVLPQPSPTMSVKYSDINEALEVFVAGRKGFGLWDHVALQSVSEFGRPTAGNGRGTDDA